VAISTAASIRQNLLPYARNVIGELTEDSRIRRIQQIFSQLIGGVL
jgi:hypothetical protein